jgi:hypothetical protein
MCGKCNELHSTSVAWLNVHGRYNTGLPDYWVLEIVERSKFTPEFTSKWGLPYFELLTCRRCGEPAFSSLHGVVILHQCPTCLYTYKERISQ